MLFMPECQYLTVISYLLQFKNHYIYHMYLCFFHFKLLLLSERFTAALFLAVPIQTTNVIILLCTFSTSKVK